MHQEFPKLMYGRGASTRLVHDAAEQDRATSDGFSSTPGDAHRMKHRAEGPVLPASVEPLTEAHIPAIVDAVFDRLKGMAVAAAGEADAKAASDAVAALHDGLDDRFGALRDGLLGEIRALIAPAPVAGGKKA